MHAYVCFSLRMSEFQYLKGFRTIQSSRVDSLNLLGEGIHSLLLAFLGERLRMGAEGSIAQCVGFNSLVWSITLFSSLYDARWSWASRLWKLPDLMSISCRSGSDLWIWMNEWAWESSFSVMVLVGSDLFFYFSLPNDEPWGREGAYWHFCH